MTPVAIRLARSRQRQRDAGRLPIRAEVPEDLRAWVDSQSRDGECRAATVERLLRERQASALSTLDADMAQRMRASPPP